MGKKQSRPVMDWLDPSEWPAVTNVISRRPEGFHPDDVRMAKADPNSEDVRRHLEPGTEPENKPTYFRIGAGIVRRAGNSAPGNAGHAELVIRVYDGNPEDNEEPSSDSPLRVVKSPTPQKNTDIPKFNVILIHLHYMTRTATELTLEYEEVENDVRGSLRLAEYIDLCRVYTTKRVLKYIALKTCPKAHSNVRSDCATLVRDFVDELVDRLKAPDTTNEEAEEQKRALTEHIRVCEGSIGESERGSRNHRS